MIVIGTNINIMLCNKYSSDIPKETPKSINADNSDILRMFCALDRLRAAKYNIQNVKKKDSGIIEYCKFNNP